MLWISYTICCEQVILYAVNRLYCMQWTSYTVCSKQVILYAVNKLYCMLWTSYTICCEQVILCSEQVILYAVNKLYCMLLFLFGSSVYFALQIATNSIGSIKNSCDMFKNNYIFILLNICLFYYHTIFFDVKCLFVLLSHHFLWINFTWKLGLILLYAVRAWHFRNGHHNGNHENKKICFWSDCKETSQEWLLIVLW